MAHGEPFPCACCGTYHMRSHDTTTVNEVPLEARVEELERQLAELQKRHDALTKNVGYDVGRAVLEAIITPHQGTV